MIFAFWKNYTPGGIGVNYQLDDEEVCAIFADLFDQYKRQFLEADLAGKLKQLRLYMEQLNDHKALLKRTPGFDICLVANIWLLERLGIITSDEYNGTMAIYQ